jgi:hypothetical protein
LEKSKKSTLGAARRQRFRLFLDKKNHEEDEVDVAVSGGGLFAALWGGPREDEVNLKDNQEVSNTRASQTLDIIQPDKLAGIAQKKGRGMVMSSWSERYLEVKPPGVLHFYANQSAADADHETEPCLELMDVQDFVMSNSIVSLVVTGESTALKFKDMQEAQNWKKALTAWKDFAYDHSSEYYAKLNSDLDNVHIGMYDDGSSPTKNFSGATSKATSNMAGRVDEIPSGGGGLDDGKPKGVEGMVEMKANSLMGEDWQPKYMSVIDAGGKVELCISKMQGGAVERRVSLAAVENAYFYNKKGVNYKRFNVDTVTNDGTLKFRTTTDLEGKNWVNRIIEWKDYALMNLTA